MPSGLKIFEDFEDEKYVHIDDLKHMVNYTCGNLNSDYLPNYEYWYNQYSYSSKAFIVCRWRQKKGLEPVAKWGEATCVNELVNYFKEHKGCSCDSVYYKYIFKFFLFCRKKMDVVAIQKSAKVKVLNYDFTVKYYPEFDEAKVSLHVTPDAVSYNLYAAEEKNILPKSNAIVSLDLRWAIPKGFYGKIFSRSGLFLNHSITAGTGIMDSGYRGIVKVLLFNHSDEPFCVKIGQRIAQLVFMEKFDVKFEMVQSPDQLDKSVRNEGGFGLTGNN